jgi:hypothetical protein
VLEICDQALLNAASARKEKDDASDDDINRAIRKLEYYEATYGSSYADFFTGIEDDLTDLF